MEQKHEAGMKTKVIAVGFGLALLTGCTSTSFMEHRGNAIIEGRGGSCRNVKGIDFWEIGEPNCKYQIIGYIQQESLHDAGDFFESAITKSACKSAIAAEAKKRGGDGVVFLSSSSQVVGGYSHGTAYTSGYTYKAGLAPAFGSYTTYGTSYTHNQVRTEKQIAVVRYVRGEIEAQHPTAAKESELRVTTNAAPALGKSAEAKSDVIRWPARQGK